MPKKRGKARDGPLPPEAWCFEGAIRYRKQNCGAAVMTAKSPLKLGVPIPVLFAIAPILARFPSFF
jgi:hypothetical protein